MQPNARTTHARIPSTAWDRYHRWVASCAGAHHGRNRRVTGGTRASHHVGEPMSGSKDEDERRGEQRVPGGLGEHRGLGRGAEVAVGESGGGLGHAVGVAHRRARPARPRSRRMPPARRGTPPPWPRAGDAADPRRRRPSVRRPGATSVSRPRTSRGDRPRVPCAGSRSWSTAIAALRPLMAITLPPGWVDAPHRYTPGMGVRGPNRLCHIWSGRHSPWKMWPPVSPMRSSTSGGPRTSRCTTASATSGAKRLMAAMAASPISSRRSLPRPVGEREGHVLGEDAHDVAALGDDRGVVRALEVELAPRRGGLAPPARLVGGLRGVDAGADGDHGPVRFDVRGGPTGSGAAGSARS